MQALADLSAAETPSVEAILGPPPAPSRASGDFEVLAEIGRGGMGVVYLARQLSLGRLVALKMLPADLAGDEVALARFRREMRLLARCEHPNIVKVLASGTMPDGRLYYAMEYVPGSDLEQVWRELAGTDRPGDASTWGGSTWANAVLSASRKRHEQTTHRPPEGPANAPSAEAEEPVPALPLPPLPELPATPDDPGGYTRRVVALVRDAALALQAVHDQNVIHRDVKPSNLMLTPDGSRVVLMDFGLAKGQSLAITASLGGGFLGTLRYAAPEQVAAARLPVGPAADVHGLGAVLWELLTRRRMFGEAEDERQLAALVHDHDVPRLRTIDASLEADLEAIVARATERRVADRIATAGLLAEYLQLYLDGKPLPIRPPSTAEMMGRWVRAHKGLVGTATAALLAVVITVVVAFVLITRSRDAQADLAKREGRAKDAANRHAAENKALALDLRSALEGVTAERDHASRENRKALQSLADFDLERGRALAEAGDSRKGLPWMARALAEAPADDPFRQHLIRFNLGSWVASTPTLKVLASHERDGETGFSPDGRTLLTAGADGIARLWKTADGTPIGPPMVHPGRVKYAKFSPDGKVVLTASLRIARLWRSDDATPIGAPMIHDVGKPDVSNGIDGITALAFSPDGKAVLTGADDRTARLWGAGDGSPIGRPMVHPGTVLDVEFSPGGKTVLTGSRVGDERLWSAFEQRWSAADGHPIGKPGSREAGGSRLVFSPDGKTDFFIDGNTVEIRDAAAHKAIGRLQGHQGQVNDAAFSPDGKKIVTGSDDRTARLWNAADGTPIGKPIEHGNSVTCVAFSPDGKAVLTASTDQTARLWSADDLSPIGGPMVHQAGIQAVKFSADGKTLFARCFDDTGWLWRLAVGVSARPPMMHPERVAAPLFSPDGRVVLTTCLDSYSSDVNKSAWLWEVADASPIGKPLKLRDAILATAFSPDGKTVLAAGKDHTARLWGTADGGAVGEVMDHGRPVSVAIFRPDGKEIVTASGRDVWRWGADGKSIVRPQLHPDRHRALAFRPDGKAVLTANEGTMRLWSTVDGAPIGEPMSIPYGRLTAVFSPDGRSILTSSGSVARLWSASGAPIGKPLEYGNGITSLAFRPDGKAVVMGSFDGTARLWSALDASPIGPPMVHREEVQAVSFSPDGRVVLTGSGKYVLGTLGEARLWSAADASPLGAPMMHPRAVQAASFSPDGTTVLTASLDRTARLWSAVDGSPIGPPMMHPDSIKSASFGPDGKSILTSDYGRTAWLWRVPAGPSGTPERIALWTEVITGLEFLGKSGTLRPLDAKAWDERRSRLSASGGPPIP